MMTRFAAIVSLLTALTAPSPACAETPADFVARIEEAYSAPDKLDALKAIFYLDGVDADTLKMYEERTIGKMLANLDAPAVTLEPLPNDFNPMYVSRGYEYRPNLELLGYVVLNGTTRAPYGRHGDRHFFTGMIRTPIAKPLGKERTLQVITIGLGHPPVRFKGQCDVMQANGELRPLAIDDNGIGNQTVAINAVHIEKCEIAKLSAHGTLSVRLLEGGNEVHVQRIEGDEARITFERPAAK